MDVEVAINKVGEASSPFGEELVLGRDFFPGPRWCDFSEHARLQSGEKIDQAHRDRTLEAVAIQESRGHREVQPDVNVVGVLQERL